MPENTKRIKGDAQGKPIPQYYNPDTDLYEALEGADGASKVMAEAGKIADLDSLLTATEAIKDTDGIKKITDPLPAGTNEIGKIAADEGKIADLLAIRNIVATQTKVLHSNATAPANGETFDVEHGQTVVLDVDYYYAKIVPEASNDEVEWARLPATNIFTGNSMFMILSQGIFAVDVSGWKHFRARLVSGSTVTVKASLLHRALQKTTSPIMIPTFKRPNPIYPEYSIEGAGATCPIYHLLPDGRGYGVTGGSVVTGLNWFNTSYELYRNYSVVFNDIHKMPNGNILLFADYITSPRGKILRSIGDNGTFEEVLTFEGPGGWPVNHFGRDYYGDVVFAGEYGFDDTTPARAYRSLDGGDTWTKIFETSFNTHHCHAVTYDPYGNILWINVGDFSSEITTFYSLDFGETWHDVGIKTPNFTGIVALPNCVLFATDSGFSGIYRWDRPVGGIPLSEKLNIEPVYSIRLTSAGAEAPIGYMSRLIEYDGNAFCLFGFTEVRDYSTEASHSIWATADGYNFFQILRSPTIYSSGAGHAGFCRVSGIDEQGYMGIIQTNVSGRTIKMKAPSWEVM